MFVLSQTTARAGHAWQGPSTLCCELPLISSCPILHACYPSDLADFVLQRRLQRTLAPLAFGPRQQLPLYSMFPFPHSTRRNGSSWNGRKMLDYRERRLDWHTASGVWANNARSMEPGRVLATPTRSVLSHSVAVTLYPLLVANRGSVLVLVHRSAAVQLDAVLPVVALHVLCCNSLWSPLPIMQPG